MATVYSHDSEGKAVYCGEYNAEHKSQKYFYVYVISYQDHTNTSCVFVCWMPSIRLNTTQDANNLGNWLVQDFERLNPDCRVLSVCLRPSGPGSLEAPSRRLIRNRRGVCSYEEASSSSTEAPSANGVEKFMVFIVLFAALCVICTLIGLFDGDSPSYEGLGGDPNPSSQSADPCSLFERNCDEGTTSGDTVPDENGDIIDR